MRSIVQKLWIMSVLPGSIAASCIQYNKPTIITNEDRNAQPIESFPPDSGLGDVTWKTLISAPDTPTHSITAGWATLAAGGGHLTPHKHEPPELYYITKGEGRMTIGGKERDVAAGDVIYIPGMVEHGIRTFENSTGELEWFYVYALDGFGQVEYVK